MYDEVAPKFSNWMNPDGGESATQEEMEMLARSVAELKKTLQRKMDELDLSLESIMRGGKPAPQKRPPVPDPVRPALKSTGASKQEFKAGMKESMKGAAALLETLGMDCDLSVKENADRAKDALGALIALQQHFLGSEAKTTSTVQYNHFSHYRPCYAIYMLSHAKDTMFKRYHKEKPYIKEFLHITGDKKTEKGAKRVIQYIAKEFPTVLTQVAKDRGLTISGEMNEIELAAMFRDAGVQTNAAKIILRHLRYKFKAKIACSFKVISKFFSDRNTEPETTKNEEEEKIQKQIQLVTAATAQGKHATKGNKITRDPNAPKKNMSAYMLYQYSLRPQNKNLTVGQMGKFSSAMYKTLGEEEIAQWEEAALQDKIRYETELAAYVPPPGFDATGNVIKIDTS